MFTVLQSPNFSAWLNKLRDSRARVRILIRLNTVMRGSLGDHKTLGGGLFELRVDYGPGYRIYFARQGEMVILLLAGGDKSSQSRDIAHARAMMMED